MTPVAPADREYIITEFQLNQLQGYASLDFICQAIRSRPHTGQPVVPEVCLTCECWDACSSCADVDKLRSYNSTKMIGSVSKRFEQLKRKGWDWSSFYNGWLEGRGAMYSELRAGERE